MSVSYILVLFLTQMAVGMVAAVALLPPKAVDPRFFGSIGFWAALFTAIGLFVRHRSSLALSEVFGSPEGFVSETWVFAAFYVFLALCVFLWLRMRFRERALSRLTLALISAAGLAAVSADSLLFRAALPPAWAQNVLLPINFVTTALVLGGFLAGMMFGHHYLIETDMPKKLLVSMAWILIGIIALRIAAVGATLWLYKAVIRPDADFLASLVSFRGHGIFFWQRALVGLFIPAIVAGMIWGTARIGSNQSATGIMYVAIAFVFIGELAARYLFFLSGIPL
jgi:anaerobic dimethyl sulfoxide reductase subunit C (anchor subunit)